jgi:uncharacterized protein
VLCCYKIIDIVDKVSLKRIPPNSNGAAVTLRTVEKKIQANLSVLREKFSVKALYVFGSHATGLATKKSDIDILVEFSSDEIGLFEFVDLKFFLESILKKKVDLVTRDAIHKQMITKIEKDSIRVA